MHCHQILAAEPDLSISSSATGWNAVHRAAYWGFNDCLVDLIGAAPITVVMARGCNNHTPLEIARLNNRLDTVRLLEDFFGDVGRFRIRAVEEARNRANKAMLSQCSSHKPPITVGKRLTVWLSHLRNAYSGTIVDINADGIIMRFEYAPVCGDFLMPYDVFVQNSDPSRVRKLASNAPKPKAFLVCWPKFHCQCANNTD